MAAFSSSRYRVSRLPDGRWLVLSTLDALMMNGDPVQGIPSDFSAEPGLVIYAGAFGLNTCLKVRSLTLSCTSFIAGKQASFDLNGQRGSNCSGTGTYGNEVVWNVPENERGLDLLQQASLKRQKEVLLALIKSNSTLGIYGKGICQSVAQENNETWDNAKVDACLDKLATRQLTGEIIGRILDNKRNGKRGEDGGVMNLYVDYLHEDRFPCRIEACGGNGGDGATGTSLQEKPGFGGNGGNGGSLGLYGESPVHRFFDLLRRSNEEKRPEVIAGALADPFSYTGKIAHAYCFRTASENNLKWSIPSNAVSSVQAMEWLRPLQVKGVFPKIVSCMLEDSSEYCSDWGLEQKNTVSSINGGQGGIYGECVGGARRGLSGNDGSRGSVKWNFSVLSLPQRKLPLWVVHPEYSSMILDKAEILYFTGDYISNRENLLDALRMLQTLSSRIAAALNGKTEEEFSAYEAEYGLVDSKNTLTSLLDKAQALALQLKSGKDYFGQDLTDVPLLPFGYYSDLLLKFLDNYKKLEDQQDKLSKQVKSESEWREMLSGMLNSVQNTISQSENQQKALHSRMFSLDREISILHQKAVVQKAEVQGMISGLEEKLQNITGYSVNDLFSALSMVGFAPKSALIVGSQIGDFIDKSTTKILTDQGESINKKYIIRQYKKCTATWAGLKEGISYLQDNDGLISMDDPGADRLWTAYDDLMALLNQFYDSLGQDMEKFSQSIRHYIDLVLERNGKVDYYNHLALEIVHLESDKQTARQKKADLNRELIKKTDLNNPAVLHTLEVLCSLSRRQIMEMLNHMQRSLVYISLSPHNSLAGMFADMQADVAVINYSVLCGIWNTLNTAHTTAMESGTASRYQRYPYLEDGSPGIVYRFTENGKMSLLKSLRKYKEIFFNIPTVLPGSGQFSIFSSWSSIRILKIFIRLEGALPASPEEAIYLELKHSGREKVLSKGYSEFQFTHDAIINQYAYKPGEKSPQIAIDLENEAMHGPYVPLSPFTDWRLTLKPRPSGKWPDLSGLTDIVLDFHVKVQSFES